MSLNYDKNSFQEQLRLLQKQYHEDLSHKIQEIKKLWHESEQASDPSLSLRALEEILYKLAGSSGHFGFTLLGNIAQILSRYLHDIVKENPVLSSAQRENVQTLLKALSHSSFSEEKTLHSAGEDYQETPTSLTLEKPFEKSLFSLYLLEKENSFAGELEKVLPNYGYSLTLFWNLDSLQEALKHQTPKALLIHTAFLEKDKNLSSWILDLQKQKKRSFPILFLSEQGDFQTRLEAVRATGDGYFTKPLEIEAFLHKIETLSNPVTTSSPFRVLIVEDEEVLSTYYEALLKTVGMTIEVLNNPLKTIEVTHVFHPDLILMDIHMPTCNGLELAQVLRQQEEFSQIPIVFISNETRSGIPIEALRAGGDDFINKPINPQQLISVVSSRARRYASSLANSPLPLRFQNKKKTTSQKSFKEFHQLLNSSQKVVFLEKIQEEDYFQHLIGKSQMMKEVFRRLKLAAQSDVTVLITGESGTGKELAAKAIYTLSDRFSKPFLAVNCSAITESLLESELFGHVKGSFTGAVRDKIGLFQAADQGVLFLDEIGDISLQLQLKLLRALQEREIRRVGDEKPFKLNVRLVAATHRNLKKLITTGEFREDFYYRIRVFEITMPPLRDRKEDIPLLINYFISAFSKPFNKKIIAVSKDALNRMMEYPWPGNVRELQNAIEHAFVTVQNSQITLMDLPEEIQQKFSSEPLTKKYATLTKKEEEERFHIQNVLRQTQGKKTEAAKLLGYSRVTLWKKIRKFELED